MVNSIEFAKNYTGILDEVYQRAAVSRCLNSGGRMVRAGHNAKEILIPKIIGSAITGANTPRKRSSNVTGCLARSRWPGIQGARLSRLSGMPNELLEAAFPQHLAYRGDSTKRRYLAVPHTLRLQDARAGRVGISPRTRSRGASRDIAWQGAGSFARASRQDVSRGMGSSPFRYRSHRAACLTRVCATHPSGRSQW